MKKIRNDTRKT